MSDTDDTDDLLLIPPDFFVSEEILIESNKPGYYGVIDNLVTEIIHLQDRVNTIESSSDLSRTGSYLDCSISNSKMSEYSTVKYTSMEDLQYPHSTQSTPQKGTTKFKLNSLPSSPNVNRFSPRKLSFTRKPEFKKHTYAPNGNEMLSDADSFLSKMKNVEKNTSRSFDSLVNKKDSQISDVDKILNEINKQNREIESRLQLKEAEILKSKETDKPNWRFQNVPEHDISKQKSTKHSAENIDLSTSIELTDKLSDSSDSTQITTFCNYPPKPDESLESPLHSTALTVLYKHKNLSESKKENLNVKNGDLESFKKLNNLDHISLFDMWNNSYKPESGDNDIGKVYQKLQEEKMRRQHCEELIKETQQNNLELQQKVSFALKVDDAKNNAIFEFKEAIQKLTTLLEQSNKEKSHLEEQIKRIKNTTQSEFQETSQKISYYEQENSKALNLVQNYQDIINSLEHKCFNLSRENDNIESKFKEINEILLNERNQKSQFSSILMNKEMELKECKQLLSDARQEVYESKKAVKNCQNEFENIKEECDSWKSKSMQNQNNIVSLNSQISQLKMELERKTITEKETHQELKKYKDQIDKNKVELRNFYQGQVEILVQSKLKQFQDQLDKSEDLFKEEVKRREIFVAKAAAGHLQNLTEKFNLEIKLLEEKHSEEIRLYQAQSMQYKAESDNLQQKLDKMQSKRVQIAQQLQKIMESQWSEALRIISSGKSPSLESTQFHELNSLKARSFNNWEEVLSQDEHKVESNAKRKQVEIHSSTPAQVDVNGYNASPKTPNLRRINEDEIEKIIHMIINEARGNDASSVSQPTKISKNSNQPGNQQHDQENDMKLRRPQDKRLDKPPWK